MNMYLLKFQHKNASTGRSTKAVALPADEAVVFVYFL